MSPPARSFARVLDGERAFRPPRWLRNGHLQTLAASQARRDWPAGSTRDWQSVSLEDGARVRVLRLAGRPGAPTLFLLHGMGGSTDSGYVRGFADKARRQGWSFAAVNLYNVNFDLERPRIFHAGSSGDVTRILERSGLLGGPLVLVGVSLGGNLLLKMLGEWAETPPRSVLAAAALSPLVDLTASWPLLDSSWLYRRYFVGRLKELARRHADLLRGTIDLDRLESVETILDYDEVVTSPLGGFENARDYYRKASARPLLGAIRIPTLVVHAVDDPVLPVAPWADEAVTANPHLGVSLQERGGHVAFLQRRRRADSDRWWAEHRIVEFLASTA